MGFGHGLWPCPQPLVLHCRHVPHSSAPTSGGLLSHWPPRATMEPRLPAIGLPVGAEVSTGFPQLAGLEPHSVTQWGPGHGHFPVQPHSVICKVRLHSAGPGPSLCPSPQPSCHFPLSSLHRGYTGHWRHFQRQRSVVKTGLCLACQVISHSRDPIFLGHHACLLDEKFYKPQFQAPVFSKVT